MANRATKEEMEERHQVALSLLQQGTRPYRVASVLMEKYGITRRRAGDYVTRARSEINLDEAANRSVAYLMGVVEDSSNDQQARMDAARALAKLGKPVKMEHAGPDGQAVRFVIAEKGDSDE